MSSWVTKRLIKAVLKWTVGPFLASEITSDQLDVAFSQGVVSFKELVLKAETINGLVSTLPVSLKHGSIKEVIVRFPSLMNILSEGMTVEIHGVRVTLETNCPEEEILTSVLHDGEDTLANSFTSSVVFGHVPEESIRDFVEEENLSGSPGNDIVGLTSILSSKIDSFLSKIRVEIQDFSLSVCTTNPSLPRGRAPVRSICVSIPELLFLDGMDVSVSMDGGDGQSHAHAADADRGGTRRADLSHTKMKKLVSKNWFVYMTEGMEEGNPGLESSSDPEEHVLLRSRQGTNTEVQLTIESSPQGVAGEDRLKVTVYSGVLDVVITPKIAALMSSFGADFGHHIENHSLLKARKANPGVQPSLRRLQAGSLPGSSSIPQSGRSTGPGINHSVGHSPSAVAAVAESSSAAPTLASEPTDMSFLDFESVDQSCAGESYFSGQTRESVFGPASVGLFRFHASVPHICIFLGYDPSSSSSFDIWQGISAAEAGVPDGGVMSDHLLVEMKGLSLDFDGGHAEKMIPSTTFVDIADVVCKERLFQGYEMRFRRNHAFGHPEVSFETLMTSCQGVWEDYFGGSELSEEKPPSAHPSRKRSRVYQQDILFFGGSGQTQWIGLAERDRSRLSSVSLSYRETFDRPGVIDHALAVNISKSLHIHWDLMFTQRIVDFFACVSQYSKENTRIPHQDDLGREDGVFNMDEECLDVSGSFNHPSHFGRGGMSMGMPPPTDYYPDFPTSPEDGQSLVSQQSQPPERRLYDQYSASILSFQLSAPAIRINFSFPKTDSTGRISLSYDRRLEAMSLLLVGIELSHTHDRDNEAAIFRCRSDYMGVFMGLAPSFSVPESLRADQKRAGVECDRESPSMGSGRRHTSRCRSSAKRRADDLAMKVILEIIPSRHSDFGRKGDSSSPSTSSSFESTEGFPLLEISVPNRMSTSVDAYLDPFAMEEPSEQESFYPRSAPSTENDHGSAGSSGRNSHGTSPHQIVSPPGSFQPYEESPDFAPVLEGMKEERQTRFTSDEEYSENRHNFLYLAADLGIKIHVPEAIVTLNHKEFGLAQDLVSVLGQCLSSPFEDPLLFAAFLDEDVHFSVFPYRGVSAQAVDLRHRQPSLVLQVVFEKLSIKLAENQGVPFPEVSAESSLFVGEKARLLHGKRMFRFDVDQGRLFFGAWSPPYHQARELGLGPRDLHNHIEVGFHAQDIAVRDVKADKSVADVLQSIPALQNPLQPRRNALSGKIVMNRNNFTNVVNTHTSLALDALLLSHVVSPESCNWLLRLIDFLDVTTPAAPLSVFAPLEESLRHPGLATESPYYRKRMDVEKFTQMSFKMTNCAVEYIPEPTLSKRCTIVLDQFLFSSQFEGTSESLQFSFRLSDVSLFLIQLDPEQEVARRKSQEVQVRRLRQSMSNSQTGGMSPAMSANSLDASMDGDIEVPAEEPLSLSMSASLSPQYSTSKVGDRFRCSLSFLLRNVRLQGSSLKEYQIRGLLDHLGFICIANFDLLDIKLTKNRGSALERNAATVLEISHTNASLNVCADTLEGLLTIATHWWTREDLYAEETKEDRQRRLRVVVEAHNREQVKIFMHTDLKSGSTESSMKKAMQTPVLSLDRPLPLGRRDEDHTVRRFPVPKNATRSRDVIHSEDIKTAPHSQIQYLENYMHSGQEPSGPGDAEGGHSMFLHEHYIGSASASRRNVITTTLEEFADSMCMETESVVVKRIGSPSQFVFEERPLEDSSSEGEEDWDEDAGRPSKTEVGGGSTVPPGVSSSYHPPSNGFSNSPYFMGTDEETAEQKAYRIRHGLLSAIEGEFEGMESLSSAPSSQVDFWSDSASDPDLDHRGLLHHRPQPFHTPSPSVQHTPSPGAQAWQPESPMSSKKSPTSIAVARQAREGGPVQPQPRRPIVAFEDPWKEKGTGADAVGRVPEGRPFSAGAKPSTPQMIREMRVARGGPPTSRSHSAELSKALEDPAVTIHPSFEKSARITNYFAPSDINAEDDIFLLPHGSPSRDVEIHLRELSVSICLFGGSDFAYSRQESWLQSETGRRHISRRVASSSGDADPNQPKRQRDNCIELAVQNLRLTAFLFNNEAVRSWRISVLLSSFEILDHVALSERNKILSAWSTAPNSTMYKSMLKVTMDGIRPNPGIPEHQELEVRVKEVGPLRVNVDQDTLDFALTFISAMVQSYIIARGDERVQRQVNQHQNRLGAKAVNRDISEEVIVVDSLGPHIKEFEFPDISLIIDYEPKRVNFSKLREEQYLELINFLPLEGMQLVLKGETCVGVDGWGTLGLQLSRHWVHNIFRTQWKNVVSGVPVLGSLMRMSEGAANLVVIPYEQYKRDRRLLHGLRKGASSLLRTVGGEVVDLTQRVAGGTRRLLENISNRLACLTMDEACHREEDGGSSSTALPNRAAVRTEEPENFTEGLKDGLLEIGKGFVNAGKTIIAVPFTEYRREGSGGAIKSLIRAVPVAVLQPFLGMSSGIGTIMAGASHSLDPKKTRDQKVVFKSKP